jgi:hypothetical protein
MSCLIYLIEIRTLLAVDLDVDEARIHRCCDCPVLEAFMGHDMAPVTGRIADGQQDRPVGFPRESKRFLPPGKPIDGIVGVLQQIRRCLVDQAVGHGKRSARLGAVLTLAAVCIRFGTSLCPLTDIHQPLSISIVEN